MLPILYIIFLTMLSLEKGDTIDIYGFKGATVTLTCPYKALSGSDLQWTYINVNFSTIVYSIGSRINNETISPVIYTRLSVVGNHAIGEYILQIRDIRESDAGRYRCNVGLQQDFLSLFLITAPLSVSIENVTSANRLVGTEGRDLIVSCVAVGGTPPPNVTLELFGSVVYTGIQSVSFTFAVTSRAYDMQTVVCKARNEANVEQPKNSSAQIYLNLKPLIPIFNPDPVTTEVTTPLVVSCTSNGSRPAATFYWTIGQYDVTSNSTEQVTYITASETYTVTSTLKFIVNRTYHNKIIVCGVANVVSTGVYSSNKLNLQFAPNIKVDNVTYDQTDKGRAVRCNPDGNPTLYTFYKWRHLTTNRVVIRELEGAQNGTLTLPSVNDTEGYQDSGEYICTASNGIQDIDGMEKQTGSGFVVVNAEPVFTKDNTFIQYGEVGTTVDILAYVVSIPKYTVLGWFKGNTSISLSNKYAMSEERVKVNDIVHSTEVQLEGYRLILKINEIQDSDINIRYMIQLFNGVGRSVTHTVQLQSASTPETPSNYTITGLSEFSITLQWDAGYNGGHEQTFYIEYRKLGSTKWTIIKIPNTQQLGRQTFTLTGLQDSTKYEIRMFAENVFNKSMPTHIDVIETTSRDITSLSTEAVVGGVVGGLTTSMAVLAILGFVIIYKRKQGLVSKNSKANSDRRKEDEAYEHISGGNINDEMSEPMNKEGVQDTSQQSCSSPPYESLGMKDIPNVYEDLKNAQQLQTTTYEQLGMKDNPVTYEELLHEISVNTDQQPVQFKTYEELGLKDSLNTYDELSSERIVNTAQRKTKEEPHLYIEIIDPKVVTQSTSTVRQYRKKEDQDEGTNYEN